MAKSILTFPVKNKGEARTEIFIRHQENKNKVSSNLEFIFSIIIARHNSKHRKFLQTCDKCAN